MWGSWVPLSQRKNKKHREANLRVETYIFVNIYSANGPGELFSHVISLNEREVVATSKTEQNCQRKEKKHTSGK